MLKDVISGLGNMKLVPQSKKCVGKEDGEIIAWAASCNTADYASMPTASCRVKTRELL